MTDCERDCPESEADDWDSHTYNAWKGGRIDYSEACDWEADEDEDEELEDEGDEPND